MTAVEFVVSLGLLHEPVATADGQSIMAGSNGYPVRTGLGNRVSNDL